MFILQTIQLTACKPFEIDCNSPTFCWFGFCALKATKMHMPSLSLPPLLCSYRLLPLLLSCTQARLCWTISPPGFSLFLLNVGAEGPDLGDLDLHPPRRFRLSPSLPFSFAPAPSVCLSVSPVCVNAAVLFCVCGTCPLSRSLWWRRGCLATP